MAYTDIRYGILLSSGQLDFLCDDHQGIHRAEALDTFVKMASMEPSHYEKKNFDADRCCHYDGRIRRRRWRSRERLGLQKG